MGDHKARNPRASETSHGTRTVWKLTQEGAFPTVRIGSRKLLRKLEGQGIQTRPLWEPIHLSQPHAGRQAYQDGVAERLYREGLSLPASVGLEQSDLERVVDALERCSTMGRW